MTFDRFEIEHVKTYLVERATVHYQQHLDLHLFRRDKLEFYTYLDHVAYGMVVNLAATLVKGEQVTHTRTQESSYTFEVFQSWWDHLKFKLNQKYKFMFKVNYQKVVKKNTISIPVQINKFCPHLDKPFGAEPTMHLHFLGKLNP